MGHNLESATSMNMLAPGSSIDLVRATHGKEVADLVLQGLSVREAKYALALRRRGYSASQATNRARTLFRGDF